MRFLGLRYPMSTDWVAYNSRNRFSRSRRLEAQVSAGLCSPQVSSGEPFLASEILGAPGMHAWWLHRFRFRSLPPALTCLSLLFQGRSLTLG